MIGQHRRERQERQRLEEIDRMKREREQSREIETRMRTDAIARALTWIELLNDRDLTDAQREAYERGFPYERLDRLLRLFH